MMALKGSHISKFLGETHYLGKSAQKSKAAHPINYFPAFLGKNIKNWEKVYFKSQILVHEYWTIRVSFWMTPARSKWRKYHIFRQYWYTKNVPVFTNTGTFQYLGREVYFFLKQKTKQNKAKKKKKHKHKQTNKQTNKNKTNTKTKNKTKQNKNKNKTKTLDT